jgi:predicted DNA-binding transcriptional regulator YafY
LGEIPTRQRLLTLLKWFQTETDEEHEFSLKDLKEKLNATYGTTGNIKDDVLREDIQALDESGTEITVNRAAHGKKLYSYQDRLFEMSELRMLMDAVVSAKFLTKKEAKILIQKLKQLASRSQARKLPHELYLDGTVRNKSDYLKTYDIDGLHRAISENRKIQFQYGTYNIDKVFELHREGDFYPVKPYALIWNNGFYYLIGEFELYEEIRHYRVDRMREVEVKAETFRRKPFNIGEYINKSFNMYAGKKEEWIELEIDNELFNVMVDRFGIDADIKRKADETFTLKTKAAISDGLINWLLSWGDEVKVLKPAHLIDRMKRESEKLYRMYHS